MTGPRIATLAAAVVLLAILWHGFSLHETCLLQGLDGNAWRIGFEVQRDFRTAFTQFASDPLQGMFDAYFPAYSEYLAPYALARVAGIAAAKSFVYSSYAAIAMGATFALARSVGIDRWTALLAGFLVPAATMPLFATPILYPIMALNPHLQHAIAVSTLVVACFWAMGRKPGHLVLILALCAIALTLLVSLATISLTALLAPAIAIYAGASLLDEPSWRARAPKILAAAALLIVPLALGVVPYVYVLTRYTAFAYFSAEFFQDRSTLVFASVLWNSGRWGVALVLGGLAGATLALLRGPRRLKLFAGTHVAATVAFQATAWAVVKWADDYFGPSPLYFEIATWPFSLLFVAYLLTAPLAMLVRSPLIARAAPALPLVAIGAAVMLFIRSGGVTCSQQVSFEPGPPNPVVRHLVEAARLEPGGPFRGFVGTFVGDVPGKPSTWLTHHAADGQAWRTTGNDMRTVGLWEFRIPTLLQYSSYITPTYYRVVSSLLARPMDRQMRSALVFSLPREAILQMLGVRFLITDHDPGFGRVVADVPVEGRPDARLIELSDPNLGGYSPTRTILAGSAQAALDALARSGFDGRTEIVLDETLDTALVPATRSRLDVLQDGLRISAESPGRSLLLLPVQYSRCWEIGARAPGVRLLRANLVQMAVMFEGKLEAELRLRFGPIWASSCRFEDMREVDRLKLREARGPTLQ